MKMKSLCAIIPAAGRGSRLGIGGPKILVPVIGERTIWHLLHERLAPRVDHIHVVVSPAGEEAFLSQLAKDGLLGTVSVSVQEQPIGMGDAIFGCHRHWKDYDDVLVVWGDQVHLSGTTIDRVIDRHRHRRGKRVTLPLAAQRKPYVEYRFDRSGRLETILQSREGDACQDGGLSDMGLFCLSTPGLQRDWLRYLRTAKTGTQTGEINFLPFLAYLSQKAGRRFLQVPVADPEESRGINDQNDLAFFRDKYRNHELAGQAEPRQPLRRVHFVCTEVAPNIVGGLGRYLERLLGQARFENLDIQVYGLQSQDRDKRAPAKEIQGNITIHRLSGGPFPELPVRNALLKLLTRGFAALRNVVYNLQAFRRIAVGTLGSREDIVSIHDWMGCITGILCRVLLGKRVFFHIHSTEMSAPQGVEKTGIMTKGIYWMEHLTARLSEGIIVPSSPMRQSLLERRWDANKLRVITHGYEDAVLMRVALAPMHERLALRHRVRGQHPRLGSKKLIVYAGRYVAHKGTYTLLEAMRLLHGTREDFQLLLIGTQCPNTNDNAMVERAISEAGMAEVVEPFYRFLNSESLYEYFVAADVCVFPSSYEPFGLVAVEAMALGKPVVLGPGFSPEVAGAPGRSSLQCRENDPRELARHIAAVLDDSALAATLAREARAHVESRFSWQNTVAETMKTYAGAWG